MSHIWDRVNAALDAEADVDRDESQNWDNATGDPQPDALSPEPPSDPVAPQFIQATDALGTAYDMAKFATQGGQDALAKIGGMIGDAMAFTKDLGELARLPQETQQAFTQHEDGFALTRIQDIIQQLEAFEQHMSDARKMLAQAVKDVDRYRADIKNAVVRT